MDKYKVATIGITQSTAEHFFDRIKNNDIIILIDVRLNNRSQLSGFAKYPDLAFFLKNICNVDYVHQPLLAPDDFILRDYRKGRIDWDWYKELFFSLLSQRKIEERLNPHYFNRTCLLCSEKEPDHCNRKLVLDYLNEKWGDILEVTHL